MINVNEKSQRVMAKFAMHTEYFDYRLHYSYNKWLKQIRTVGVPRTRLEKVWMPEVYVKQRTYEVTDKLTNVCKLIGIFYIEAYIHAPKTQGNAIVLYPTMVFYTWELIDWFVCHFSNTNFP